jgi:hypothetical protein
VKPLPKTIKWWVFTLERKGRNVWTSPPHDVKGVGQVLPHLSFRQESGCVAYYHAVVQVGRVKGYADDQRPEVALMEAYAQARQTALDMALLAKLMETLPREPT